MESTTINNSIKEVREFFNDIRGSLSREEINRIRKELYKKEAVYNSLKEKDSLTNKQKNVLKNIGRYLKNYKNYSEELQKYQYNITYGLDYLFNEVNEEDYYKPTETKSAFDGNYVAYESRGDKDGKLALYECFEKIKPHLNVLIYWSTIFIK